MTGEFAASLISLARGAEPPPPQDWESWERAVVQHGLVAPAYRFVRNQAGAPPDLEARLRDHAFSQSARGRQLVEQLREISAAFAGEGLDWIALKGAAAMATLYAGPGERRVSDLDLLIRQEDTERASGVMRALGYGQPSAFPSAEEARARSRQSHLAPFHRQASLPVELHLGILHGRGRPESAHAEIWSAPPRWVTLRDLPLRVLSRTHFLLHAASHYSFHYHCGPSYLAWLVDLRLGAAEAELDWELFWTTADRWGLPSDIQPVLATVRDLLGTQVGGLKDTVRGWSAAEVIAGAGQPTTASRGWAAHRLRLLSDVPGLAGRLRFLFRCVFPEASYLRERYGLPAGAPVAGSRCRYLAEGASRLAGSAGSRKS